MTTPLRIQRKRTKGFKLVSPNGLPVVCVSRGTRWGNPHVAGMDAAECVRKYLEDLIPYTHNGPRNGTSDFLISEANLTSIRQGLRGKNLACWCGLCDKHQSGKPLGVRCDDCDPCHADPLLELANG